MIKIKKIYIENFKCVRDKQIIDLQGDSFFLTGPNGFGKTTIFDALEICLTGSLNRLEANHSEHDRASYKNAFYQNTPKRPVVLKILLEKDGNELAIVRYDEGHHDLNQLKPKELPFHSFRQAAQNFKESILNENLIDLISITQNDINKFIDSNVLKSYLLFNYIQQEETTYFLKKSQNDRKEEIDILTYADSDNVFKLEKSIKDITSKVDALSNDLKLKIRNLVLNETPQQPYEQLIKNSTALKLDLLDPFEELNDDFEQSYAIKQQILNDLNQLEKFCNDFKINEYEKYTKLDWLNILINDPLFHRYVVLSKIIKTNQYDALVSIEKLINSPNQLRAFILQKVSHNIKDYKIHNEVYDKLNKFSLLESKLKQLQMLENIFDVISFDEKNKKEQFSLDYSNYLNLLAVCNNTDQIIQEVIRLRNELIEKYKENDLLEADPECILCGSAKWVDNINTKEQAFEDKYKRLALLQSEQSKSLEKSFNTLVSNYLEPVLKQIHLFLDKGRYDQEIIDILEAYQLNDILEQARYNEFIWSTIEAKNLEDLYRQADLLKDKLINDYAFDIKIYNLALKLQNLDYSSNLQAFNFFINETNALINYSESFSNYSYIEALSAEVETFLMNLKNTILIDQTVVNSESLQKFKIFFDNNIDSFNNINKDKILRKKQYIEYIFTQRFNLLKSKLERRLTKIDQLLSKLMSLQNVYDVTIKEFKKDLIRNIKIPFYIYSSKILQNYTQGMGIFILNEEGSGKIVFSSINSKDHDISRKLSSGQLAVVSIAFLLSMNKVYGSKLNQLKLLAIDDPIQDMDALNIHTFIELLRHEFVNQYQIIMATHDDFSASYMKYKLDQYLDKPIKVFNVQNEFFK